MTIEAMKLALDALRMPCDRWNAAQAKKVKEAIAEIEAAIKDAEAQKPIATWQLDQHHNIPKLIWREDYKAIIGDALYTHPAPLKRLTDAEEQVAFEAWVARGTLIPEVLERVLLKDSGSPPMYILQTTYSAFEAWKARARADHAIMDAMGVKE
jgi:hypothetical protein